MEDKLIIGIDEHRFRLGFIEKLKKQNPYPRKARKDYLSFSMKKRKTKKTINKAKKQMLQYLRRNIKQLKDAIEQVKTSDQNINKTSWNAYRWLRRSIISCWRCIERESTG